MIRELKKDEDFMEVVRSYDKVVVDFYASWCGPCQLMMQVFERMEEEGTDVNIIKVNVDDFRDLAMKYGIASIPTLVAMNDGIEYKRHIGMMSSEELEDMVK